VLSSFNPLYASLETGQTVKFITWLDGPGPGSASRLQQTLQESALACRADHPVKPVRHIPLQPMALQPAADTSSKPVNSLKIKRLWQFPVIDPEHP
jgi:hypothetical protein